ncbi:MAG: flagellar basal body rod C-terminal domain-containing protein [Pseudomonadota bacterium]
MQESSRTLLYGDRLSTTASKIAKADNAIKQSDLDLQDDIVDMILIEQGVKANIKVVQTADELQDQLIDIIS